MLETAHPAVHTLLRLGVPSANISLIGKCYSTDKDVFHALRAPDLGVHVADSCLEYVAGVSLLCARSLLPEVCWGALRGVLSVCQVEAKTDRVWLIGTGFANTFLLLLTML